MKNAVVDICSTSGDRQVLCVAVRHGRVGHDVEAVGARARPLQCPLGAGVDNVHDRRLVVECVQELLREVGGRTICVQVQWRRVLPEHGGTQAPEGSRIERLDELPAPEDLRRLAIEAGRYSRFRLDPKISREVMGLIKSMAKEFGVPSLCNIHDVNLAMEFCNKMIGLQDGIMMFDGPTSSMNEEKLNDIYAMEVL